MCFVKNFNQFFLNGIMSFKKKLNLVYLFMSLKLTLTIYTINSFRLLLM
jgi:hypothetical protein